MYRLYANDPSCIEYVFILLIINSSLNVILKKRTKLNFSNVIMILPNLPRYTRLKSKLELMNTVKKREHFKQ